jgi:hypothetical protein
MSMILTCLECGISQVCLGINTSSILSRTSRDMVTFLIVVYDADQYEAIHIFTLIVINFLLSSGTTLIILAICTSPGNQHNMIVKSLVSSRNPPVSIVAYILCVVLTCVKNQLFFSTVFYQSSSLFRIVW